MLTEEELQDIIAGKIVGNQFPYDTNDNREIEAHIRRLYHRINRIPHIICEAEWDHFGSGYASFVEFFCYPKENISIIRENPFIQEELRVGIIIDICRLAPVAIIGEDRRYKTICKKTNEVIGGAYGTLLDGAQNLIVSKNLQSLARKITEALHEYQYELLDSEYLSKPLPFQTKIPTLYRNPGHYQVMDAYFYWED